MKNIKKFSNVEKADIKLNKTYDYLEKNYFNNLNKKFVQSLPEEVLNSEFSTVKILKFERIIYDKHENNLTKLLNIYKSLYNISSSIFVILDAKKSYVDYYMGIKIKDKKSSLSSFDVLKKGYQGNFPGIVYNEDFKIDKIEKLMKKVTTGIEVSSVTQIPSLKSEEKKENLDFVQGIEKFIEGMMGQEYTAILLADPVSRDYLAHLKKVYQSLYNEIFPFSTIKKAISDSEAISMIENYSTGETFSETKGTSTSYSEGTTTTNTYSAGINSSTTSMLSVGLGVFATSIGMGIAKTLGISLGYARSTSKSKSTTDSTNESDTNSTSTNEGVSEGVTSTLGNSLDVTFENKGIKYLLEKIETQFERNKEFENYGAWQSAAYFFSNEPQVSRIAASYYSSLISGENTNIEKAYINSWLEVEEKKEVEKIKDYLFNLYHPLIQIDKDGTIVTPAMTISTRELTISHSLPKKSIAGLPVHESASFGRQIFSKKQAKNLEIGNIYHLNKEEEIKVKLDLNSLTSHTFITGSTGSGKSNAIYSILEELYYKNIKFMVIEPAKGEYKNVFGGKKNISVYGTNSNVSEILRINPFSFNDKIHILEHIDRLIEIFNACWPMYAAMPAILKEALEIAYIGKGWDLDSSINMYRRREFPTFITLKNSLEKVIMESSYSDEFKSNYKGALVTRVNSLSNGLIGRIFTDKEIEEKDLFDENVIIDLSRISSTETKSLIMGILFIKLQEFRMVSLNNSNEDLKHITVMEEAHNLLRKTSTSQSQEGSNLQGKSIEMITNAIAEMRTYGEGFIIADQAPGLLDEAVIRNTNTKICLRLPSMDDREIVGKAMNLNEEQISELARLETGVAAVYQNDWNEACLIKFNHMLNYDSYVYERKNEVIPRVDILKYLLDSRLPENEKEKNNLKIENTKKYLEKNIKDLSIVEIDKMIYEILEGDKIFKIIDAQTSDNLEIWLSKIKLIFQNYFEISVESIFGLELISSIIREKTLRNSEYEKFYVTLNEFIIGEGKNVGKF
ncbi:ATP-binding protein [Cetobacterium somerae]